MKENKTQHSSPMQQVKSLTSNLKEEEYSSEINQTVSPKKSSNSNGHQSVHFQLKKDSISIPEDKSLLSLFSENAVDSQDETSQVECVTDNNISKGLSNIGYSGCGTKQIFLNLSLTDCGINDISCLRSYTYLCRIDLSFNEISDIYPLQDVTHLTELDVSHNKIRSILNFVPPAGLREAIFSHNQIEKIPDLKAFSRLVSLELDHNCIATIEGIQGCNSLRHLTLSHNAIEEICGLENLSLRKLSLNRNKISRIENLETLADLQELNLIDCFVSNLSGISNNNRLCFLNMQGNNIYDLSELRYIASIKNLHHLCLLGNPVSQIEGYRKYVIFAIQQLIEVDYQLVSAKDKVAALNLYNPPPEVQAALDHITNTVYRFFQPTTIYDCTLPNINTPYPLLILTGPQACGKRELAHKLVLEFPNCFGFGISHTSRIPYAGEQNGKDYYFVSTDRFQALTRQGCFIQTHLHQGALYGLTIDAIEAVAGLGLACVTHMELNGVYTLKNTYFEPRYVLLLPSSSSAAYRKRMIDRDIYLESHIEYVTQERRQIYQRINQERPGFFNKTINSDNLDEAYDKLRQLVMEYLGTTDLNSVDNESVPSLLSSTEYPDRASSHHHHSALGNIRKKWSRLSFYNDQSSNHDQTSSTTFDLKGAPTRERLTSLSKILIEEENNLLPVDNNKNNEDSKRCLILTTAPGKLEGRMEIQNLNDDDSNLETIFSPFIPDDTNMLGAHQYPGGSLKENIHFSSRKTSYMSNSARSSIASDLNAETREAKIACNVPEHQVLDIAALHSILESMQSSNEGVSHTNFMRRSLSPFQSARGNIGFERELTHISLDSYDSLLKPVIPPIPTMERQL